MSELITKLKQHLDEQEREYKKKKCDYNEAKEAYEKALYDETHRKKIILAKHFLKVINAVHKNNLRCVGIKDVDPKYVNDPYLNPTFVVQDGDKCVAHITVQDGVVHGERGECFSQQTLDRLVYDMELLCKTIKLDE